MYALSRFLIFSITPEKVIGGVEYTIKSKCTLGTALMIFYLADGYRYLTERSGSSDLPEWLPFISNLYKRIVSGGFTDRSIAFSVPLSKVQIFKLKKQLHEDEQLFITSIEGENCDITV